MKILITGFSLILFFTGFNENKITVKTEVETKQIKIEDWSALFPEIPNCERVIQPLTQNGEVFEQTAVYERENYETLKKNQFYFPCGSITLRVAPSAKKSAELRYLEILGYPITKKLKIKNFDAFHHSPLCGNDEITGSDEVYLDEDKVLLAVNYRITTAISEFVQTADYELIKNSMEKLVKNKSRRAKL